MDKYQQIMKLAQAAELIQEVNRANPEFAGDLQDIADNIANIADDIEQA